jgi:Med18 protein
MDEETAMFGRRPKNIRFPSRNAFSNHPGHQPLIDSLKMHELFLFAQLPHTRRQQLRSILTGIAAHHPIPATELYTIAEPTRSTAAPPLERDASLAARNAGNTIVAAPREALHMHLVRKLTREDFGAAEPLRGVGFRVRFPDIPEPGAREIGLRRVDEFPVEYPDAEDFIRLYGYRLNRLPSLKRNAHAIAGPRVNTSRRLRGGSMGTSCSSSSGSSQCPRP